MSIAMMAEVWRRQVVATEQQVLLVLCDHVHDDGTRCFPSVPLIAWKIGVSDRTVRRIIKSLEGKGVLVVEREDGKSNTYRINLDALPPKDPFRRKKEPPTPDTAMSPRQDVTPDTAMSPHPGHNDVTPTPDTAMSAKPSVEPSEKHQGGKRSRRKPEVPFPKDFTLTEGRLNYAIKEGMDRSRTEYQFERLRNWAAMYDIRRADWDAQWRNWVLKDIRENGKSATPDQPKRWKLNANGVMVEVPA